MNKIKIIRSISIGLIALLALFLWSGLAQVYPQPLVINEVSFTNNDGSDWIELHNPTISSVSLRGYYLSDNENNLTKFQITSDVVMRRRGFVVFYGESASTTAGMAQVSFNVKNGETIYLTASDGMTILDRLTVLADTDDVNTTSVGRFPDGRVDMFTFTEETPGARNIKDKLGALKESEL